VPALNTTNTINIHNRIRQAIPNINYGHAEKECIVVKRVTK